MYHLANEMSETFAAIAPVAGPMALHPHEVKPGRGMPIIHFHGDEDEFTPFTGGNGPHSVGVDRLDTNNAGSWATANQCANTPQVSTLHPIVDDDTTVEVHDYGSGRDGSEMLLFCAWRRAYLAQSPTTAILFGQIDAKSRRKRGNVGIFFTPQAKLIRETKVKFIGDDIFNLNSKQNVQTLAT